MIKIFFTEEKKIRGKAYYFRANWDVGKIKTHETMDATKKNFIKELEELKKNAKNQEIQIFYDDLAESACGMHATIHYLCRIDTKISIVKLLKKNATWGDIADEDINLVEALEQVLSKEEIVGISMDWSVCISENANLRAVINGKVMSVKESFYDDFILKNIKEGEYISMYILMARTISYCPNRNSKFILERINKLTEEGIFAIVDINEDFYKSLIKLEE